MNPKPTLLIVDDEANILKACSLPVPASKRWTFSSMKPFTSSSRIKRCPGWMDRN
jgi:hypothetical protein